MLCNKQSIAGLSTQTGFVVDFLGFFLLYVCMHVIMPYHVYTDYCVDLKSSIRARQQKIKLVAIAVIEFTCLEASGSQEVIQ